MVRELFLPEYFGKCKDKNQILYLLNFHSLSVQMYFICVMVSYFSCVYFHCPSHPLNAFLAYITWLFLFLSVSNKDVVILKSQYVYIVSVQKIILIDFFFDNSWITNYLPLVISNVLDADQNYRKKCWRPLIHPYKLLFRKYSQWNSVVIPGWNLDCRNNEH